MLVLSYFLAILLFCTITEITGRALRAVIWYFRWASYPDDPDMNSYYPFSWFKNEPDPLLHFFCTLLFWWLVNNQLVDRRFNVTAQRVGEGLGLLVHLRMEW